MYADMYRHTDISKTYSQHFSHNGGQAEVTRHTVEQFTQHILISWRGEGQRCQPLIQSLITQLTKPQGLIGPTL